MQRKIVAIIFVLVQAMLVRITDNSVFINNDNMQHANVHEVLLAPELRNNIQRDLRPIGYRSTLLTGRSIVSIDEKPVIEEEYVIDVTEKEISDLEALVCAEVGNMPEEEQIATAATIVNRVESSSPDFVELNTITDVIFQENQFSTVKDGKIYQRQTEVTQEMISDVTKRAVQKALKGEDPTEELLKQESERLGLDVELYVADGATFFYSPKWMSEKALASREQIKVKIQYGEHVYYTYWDR